MLHLYCMQQDSNLRLLTEADYESAALTTQLYMLKLSAICSLLFVLQNCSIIQVTRTLLALCLITVAVSLASQNKYKAPPCLLLLRTLRYVLTNRSECTY